MYLTSGAKYVLHGLPTDNKSKIISRIAKSNRSCGNYNSDSDKFVLNRRLISKQALRACLFVCMVFIGISAQRGYRACQRKYK